MHETLHSDVIGTHAICSNELCRYLKLVLRRAAGAKVERTELARKAVKPVTHLFRKPRNWHRIVFQHYHPTRFPFCPLKCTPVIPVGTMITFIDKQVSVKHMRQQFCLMPA
jgi:hypothetical protein